MQLFCPELHPETKKRRFDQSAFAICNFVCAEFHGIVFEKGFSRAACPQAAEAERFYKAAG